MISNIQLSQEVLKQLASWGVREISLCPGGRNAPLVVCLESSNFQVTTSFDERSASFFALGRARITERPVAIIVTSGTAVAELLPAIIEAHYNHVPLIVISADRPPRLRGTGSPQTIEQLDIFSSYVEKCVDVSEKWPSYIDWSGERPLHLNICFDEPLLDDAPKVVEYSFAEPEKQSSLHQFEGALESFLKSGRNPLLLIGGLSPAESAALVPFVKNWQGLVYAESTSGLRELEHPYQVRGGERILTQFLKSHLVDGVLRLGGVPTTRLWRDLEDSEIPVLSFSSRPFAGLSRGHFHKMNFLLQQLPQLPFAGDQGRRDVALVMDQKRSAKVEELLLAHPKSEPALVRWLSQQLPAATTVYVGNSLPLREWDLAAQREHALPVWANRGANGIDGQLSTAMAFVQEEHPLCALVGDLTAMYDMNAPWFLKQHPAKAPLWLCVMNNKGGRIFERMFRKELFYNTHDLNFEHWAHFWSQPYQQITTAKETTLSLGGVVELLPEASETEKFWNQLQKISESP